MLLSHRKSKKYSISFHFFGIMCCLTGCAFNSPGQVSEMPAEKISRPEPPKNQACAIYPEPSHQTERCFGLFDVKYEYINSPEPIPSSGELVFSQQMPVVTPSPRIIFSDAYAGTLSLIFKKYGIDYKASSFIDHTPFNCVKKSQNKLTFSQITYSITSVFSNARGFWYVDQSDQFSSEAAAASLDKSVVPPIFNRKIRDSYCQFPGIENDLTSGFSYRLNRSSATVITSPFQHTKKIGIDDDGIDDDYPVLVDFRSKHAMRSGMYPSQEYLSSLTLYAPITWTRNNKEKTPGGITPIKNTAHLVDQFTKDIPIIAATTINGQQFILPIKSIAYITKALPKPDLNEDEKLVEQIYPSLDKNSKQAMLKEVKKIKEKISSSNQYMPKWYDREARIVSVELFDTTKLDGSTIKIDGDEFLKNSDFIFALKI